MRSHPALRAVALLGLGFAGLVGGHALGYAIAHPDVHERAVVLMSSGHGYLPSATWAAVMLGMSAVVAGIAAGYLRRPHQTRPSLGAVAPRLALLQASAFVALELAERLAAGTSFATLSPRLLLAGVATQIVVALLIALLVSGLRRVGEALRAPRQAEGHPPTTSWPLPVHEEFRRSVLQLCLLARAPPSFSAA